ncbi:MAG: hypothetical protein AAFV53_25345 [Myxococcota bacterium]
MIRQDYILDLIEQAVRFLTQALNLEQAGEVEQAHRALEQAGQQLVGMRLSLAAQMDPDTLLLLMRAPDGSLDEGRAMVLGALLTRRAMLMTGEVERRRHFLAAVSLLTALDQESTRRLPVETLHDLEAGARSIGVDWMPFRLRARVEALRGQAVALADEE